MAEQVLTAYSRAVSIGAMEENVTPTKPTEDRTRGQRSGEGSGTALRALRRDEKRRSNQWSDSVLPQELPPLIPEEPAPRRTGQR